jgi:hypothetical protein
VILSLLPAALAGTKVDPPLSATVYGTRHGHILEYDGEGFTFRDAQGAPPRRFQWGDLPPRAVITLNEKLFGRSATAVQWFELGSGLLKHPGGSAAADQAFMRAMKLDPSIRPQIEMLKRSTPPTPAATTPRARGAAAAPPPTTSPWGSETEQEHAASVADIKRFANHYQRLTTAKLLPYETQYFLFCSNLPQSEAVKWTGLLDNMYARLSEIFDIPKGHNLWRGKALIIVFLSQDDFEKFEVAAFKNDKKGPTGFCHAWADGTVVITFYRSRSEMDFARLLVHESTHGFLHRYRSPEHIASWANEGLAEVLAYELVPHAGIKQAEDARARSELRRPRPLEHFFDEGKNIDGFQYPIARTLCEFMIRQDKAKYVEFIKGMKDGLSWEQALASKYGTSVEALLAAYGQQMGVPGLKPQSPPSPPPQSP